MSIRESVRTSIKAVLEENVMEVVAEAMGSNEVRELIKEAVVGMIAEELKAALADTPTPAKPLAIVPETKATTSPVVAVDSANFLASIGM